MRERLENVGRLFLHGYHAGLQDDQAALAQQLSKVPLEHQGFAYEGAAMALALLDGISPWRKDKRFSRFVVSEAQRHICMVHVGAGWAFARLPWLRRSIESVICKFHPVLRWLAVDGYGFHEGYFHWRSALQTKISALSEHARHIFYQGLGRSLWFLHAADSSEIDNTISMFAPQFQSDAWSGVGLACAYAGGTSENQLEELAWRAASNRAALAQGAAFAAKARQLAGNPAPHAELACGILCGMTADTAAALCDETLQHVDLHHSCPYQQWRELIQERLTPSQAFERQPAWVC